MTDRVVGAVISALQLPSGMHPRADHRGDGDWHSENEVEGDKLISSDLWCKQGGTIMKAKTSPSGLHGTAAMRLKYERPIQHLQNHGEHG